MDTVKSGIYKHFKGGFVLVLFVAKHSDRDEMEVVYVGLNNGKYYARPIESFNEQVQDENGNLVSRFCLAELDEVKNLMTQELKQKYNLFCGQ